MSKLIDIAGQRFGFWVALKLSDKNSKNQTQWLCECECGTQRLVTSNSLRSGNSTSCGCNHNPNLTNRVFGSLLVLKLDDTKKNKGRRYWVSKCSCGRISSYTTNQLLNNLITACECNKNINLAISLSSKDESYRQQITNIIVQAVFAAMSVIKGQGLPYQEDIAMLIGTTTIATVMSMKEVSQGV